jgi:hypothetical protein
MQRAGVVRRGDRVRDVVRPPARLFVVAELAAAVADGAFDVRAPPTSPMLRRVSSATAGTSDRLVLLS